MYTWPLLLLRTCLRMIRDLDGLLSYLCHQLYKKPYRLQGMCKKRGICCQNIAIHLSNSFWQIPTLKSLAKTWYTFVYHFQFTQENSRHRVLLFSCRYLNKHNQCDIYFKRPFICRGYPASVRYFERPTLLPGCGYKLQKHPS